MRIFVQENGVERLIPNTPEVPTRGEWQRFLAACLDMREGLKCGACWKEVSFWEGYEFSQKGSAGKKILESRGSIVIGTRTRFLRVDRVEVRPGRPDLEICSWLVVPMVSRAPGCKDCQIRLMKVDGWTPRSQVAFLDLQRELESWLRSAEVPTQGGA